MFSRKFAGGAAVAILLLAAGCGKAKNNGPNTGSASIMAHIKAATPDQVQSLHVTVTAPDIAAPIAQELAKDSSGIWRGTITGIPAGPGRTFTAQALDAWGQLLYQGSAVADVIANQTVVVVLNLQEATPPIPFVNSVPYFTSLVASTNRVAPGGQVDLRATAADPDGDLLTYTWSASGGSYSGAASADGGVGTATGASAMWTAPAATGSYTLTVEVADGKGGTASLALTITVSGAAGQTGTVDIEISLNTWPLVSSMSGTPSPMAAGQPLNLNVVASDPDGDPLSYAWASSCAGAFSASSTVQNPVFTLDASATASSCTFTVTVSDSRGGHNTGTQVVQVGAPVVPTITMLAVSPLRGLVTSEAGGSATFTVWLKGPPTADVLVAITSEDISEGTVSPSSLTFTADTWSVPQVVTVTGAPDDGDTADQDYTVVVGPCTSSDPLFAAVSPIRVSLTNQDPAAVHFSQTTLVSVAAGGGSGDLASGAIYKATRDARFVAFNSDASNLVAGDTNGVTDVFVRDMMAGTTTRVSVASDGSEADGVSGLVDISADGRYVLFNSYADNLVAGDTNTRMDVFLHDLQTHQTTRMSARAATSPDGGASGPEQSTYDSSGLGITSDSTFVGLQSSLCSPYDWSGYTCLRNVQTGELVLLPGSGWGSIESSSDGRYVLGSNSIYDVTTGTLTRVDVANDGTVGNGGSNSFHMSSDARYIVFESWSTNLVPNDTNGARDVFLRDRVAGTTTRVSISATGSQALGESYGPNISHDGRYVLFISNAKNLIPGDTTTDPQAFIRDMTTGEVRRPRSPLPPWYPSGYGYCYEASFSSDQKYVLCSQGYPRWVHELSSNTTGVFGNSWSGDNDLARGLFLANDRYILFTSTANLAGDTNGVTDLFITPVPPINVSPSF